MVEKFNRFIERMGILTIILLWGIAILIRTIIDSTKKILKIRR
jgi:hypothetical protein